MILIKTLFFFFRFLVLRRRNRGFTQSTQARINRGFIANSPDNSNNIWMTAYPPPSYENIYNSSFSINTNRLPDYNSTIVTKKTNKNDTDNNNNNNNNVSEQILEQSTANLAIEPVTNTNQTQDLTDVPIQETEFTSNDLKTKEL
jgi:hypothetical protein